MTCHICAKTNCIGECEPKIGLYFHLDSHQFTPSPRSGPLNYVPPMQVVREQSVAI